MVVGLVGHPFKLHMIEQILTQLDSSITVRKMEFSEIASERQIQHYEELQDTVDIVLFGGYYDYLFFCNHLVFRKVTGYVPRDITTLMRSLLEAQLAQYDIFHISIDGYADKELHEMYHEIGRNMADIYVYSWYENYPLSPQVIEDTFLFHKQNYNENNVSVCMTCISVVYEKLCHAGIPAMMINATSENVRIAYEKLRLEYLLRTKETSDIALLDINVIGKRSSMAGKDEYLLNVEKLHIAESIFLFTRKLQAAVEELNLGHYLIISSTSALERETNFYKKISLLEDMSQFHHCRLCAGIGYGNSMREIQRNAQIALQKARGHNTSCIYMMYDSVNIVGPLFRDPPNIQDSPQEWYACIAQQTGLSVNTIQKLQFIIERYKSNTFTVNELSLIYGISLRSMYRMIDKLAICGYAEERGKQIMDGAGRPGRMIEINFQQKRVILPKQS